MAIPTKEVILAYRLSVALLILLTLNALIDANVGCAADADKPNILFIMSDDHAAHAIGAYGGRLAALNPTPTLDRLAAEGVRFTNAFCTNSICTPSRATLLTGQYSHVNGVTTLSGRLEADRQYLATAMRQAGYETAMIGKWHLKAEPAAFDYYAVLAGQGNYFNPIFRVQGPQPWPENTVHKMGYNSVHSSDAVTKLSLEWLKQRKRDKPFFLMHHFKAPHDNFENAERYDWLYQDIDIPEPPSLRERGNHGPLGRPRYGTSVGLRNEYNMGRRLDVDRNLAEQEYLRESYQRYLKKFLRCVRGLDDNIAKLLKHLKSTGELDNTIIIYTADQGFMLGEHDYIDKRWMYEESLRMPFIVRDPRAKQEGQICDAIVNNVDFAPTLLAMAGAETPTQMQGRSFWPLVQGEPVPADWPTATYYRYWMHMAHHHNPAHYGIRTKDHKLIFFYGLPLDAPGAKPNPTEPHWEMYDLSNDPQEMNNVVADPAYADKLASLKLQLQQLQSKIGDTDEKYPGVTGTYQSSEGLSSIAESHFLLKASDLTIFTRSRQIQSTVISLFIHDLARSNPISSIDAFLQQILKIYVHPAGLHCVAPLSCCADNGYGFFRNCSRVAKKLLLKSSA